MTSSRTASRDRTGSCGPILTPPQCPARSSGPEHQVGVLVHSGRPARMHERARVVLLDDRGTFDHVAPKELRAIEHDGPSKTVRLREPHVTTPLHCGSG